MMNWWHYLLLVNLYLVLFFVFYNILLRRETFFHLNRIYLVAGSLLSFFIPLMQSEWIQQLFITKQVHQTIYASVNPEFIYQVKPVNSNPVTLGELLAYIYIAGAALLFCRLIYQLLLIKKLINRRDASLAFSFFKTIQVAEDLPNQKTILEHEQVHTREWHSADVLLIEAVMIINWFNPVVYFYRKAIKHVHEFIADRKAIQTGTSKTEYALMLVSQTFGTNTHYLANNFFNHSLLKQRILMLDQDESSRRTLLKYVLSAPLFAIMLVFSSATVNNSKLIKVIDRKSDQAFAIHAIKFTAHPEQMIAGNNPSLQAKVIAKNDRQSSQSSLAEKLQLTIDQNNTALNDQSPVFSAVEVNPSFPGGDQAFNLFLAQHIRYPTIAKEKNTSGRVFISFTIEKDGTLSDMKNLRDPGDGLGDEAMRVLASSPKWIPGIQNGKPVRVKYTVPVNFQMADDAEHKKTMDTVRIQSVNYYKRTAADSAGNKTKPANPTGNNLNSQIAIIQLNGKVISHAAMNRLDASNIRSINIIRRDTAKPYTATGSKTSAIHNMIVITTKDAGASKKN